MLKIPDNQAVYDYLALNTRRFCCYSSGRLDTGQKINYAIVKMTKTRRLTLYSFVHNDNKGGTSGKRSQILKAFI